MYHSHTYKSSSTSSSSAQQMENQGLPQHTQPQPQAQSQAPDGGVPPALASTLEHIIGQLDILTQVCTTHPRIVRTRSSFYPVSLRWVDGVTYRAAHKCYAGMHACPKKCRSQLSTNAHLRTKEQHALFIFTNHINLHQPTSTCSRVWVSVRAHVHVHVKYPLSWNFFCKLGNVFSDLIIREKTGFKFSVFIKKEIKSPWISSWEMSPSKWQMSKFATHCDRCNDIWGWLEIIEFHKVHLIAFHNSFWQRAVIRGCQILEFISEMCCCPVHCYTYSRFTTDHLLVCLMNEKVYNSNLFLQIDHNEQWGQQDML